MDESPELTRRAALRGLLALVASACSPAERERAREPDAGDDGGRPPAPVESPAASPIAATDAAAIAVAMDAFAVDLHRRLAQPDANLVVSPSSIALAFGMLHAGARGRTAQELAAAFHWQGQPAALHAGFAELLSRWAAPSEGVDFSVANRLFGDQGVAFDRAYLELGTDVFGAPLESLDFRGDPEAARAHINAWVEAQTHERIRDLLPAGTIDARSRLVLVDAVYFKARWATPFLPHLTRDADFTTPHGVERVAMMHRSGTMPVARHDGATIVELDYGVGDYAMTFIVPDRADALAALERRFDRAWLAEGLAAMSDGQVTLGVPKFRIEADRPLALRSVLGAMGVSQVFTSEADLTGIAPRSEQLMVSEAFHKAFIELDEAGTEAAAATAIATRTGAAAPPEGGTRVVLDRPFLFALRDRESGAMLFLGHVVDPTR